MEQTMGPAVVVVSICHIVILKAEVPGMLPVGHGHTGSKVPLIVSVPRFDFITTEKLCRAPGVVVITVDANDGYRIPGKGSGVKNLCNPNLVSPQIEFRLTQKLPSKPPLNT